MIYLLDTNVCVDVLRGRTDVTERLRQLSPDDCAVSSISVFELFSGARKSMDPSGEAAKVQRLAHTLVLRSFDVEAADRAASVRWELEQRGEKIGAYDTLLAGHALALGLIYVTDNTKEFARVPELTVENWRITPSP